MRLFKKLVSGIAMTAMCCTLVVPIVSNAGTGTGACPGHIFVKKEYIGTEVLHDEEYTHTFYVGETKHTCIVQTLEDYYISECCECGQTRIETVRIIQHLDLYCSFNH